MAEGFIHNIMFVPFYFTEKCNKKPKYGSKCQYVQKVKGSWKLKSCAQDEVFSGSSCGCQIDCKWVKAAMLR